MDHSPDRPSHIVKLKVRKPSLLVKLQLKERAAAHAMKLRRRNSADSTTAPGTETEAEAASDSDLDRRVLKLKVPNISQTSASTPPADNSIMARREPPILDQKLFGRERSTRKRKITPTSTGTMHRDPLAKKRKLNSIADAPQAANVPGSASLNPAVAAPVKLRRTRGPTIGVLNAPPTPLSEGPTPPQMAQRAESPRAAIFLPPAASHIDSHGHVRPLRDPSWDQTYVHAMFEELDGVLKQKRLSVHKRSAGRIRDLLFLATYPNADEAKFLCKDEALAEVAPGNFFNGPVITAEQQPLPLSNVVEFLGEYYDDAATVHIQDSSSSTGKTATWARSVTMRQVKERFQEANTPEHCPWNMLELATHHDDGLRPAFLNNEDCRLITKLKIPNLNDETRRRKYEPGFKEVEKWALLAEAGALTEPHQDSHGYSTFITINQGCVGFGWLSHPTREQRAAWRHDPQRFRDGRWRYVVLKPGQTVFFPAGTVHMVFRLKEAGNSLAFGGHILRCSNIVHWITTILEEHGNQNIVNEDLGDAAVGYLERVDSFVVQATKQGTEDKWGGKDSIKEFQKLKQRFMGLPKPRVSPPRKKTAKKTAKSR